MAFRIGQKVVRVSSKSSGLSKLKASDARSAPALGEVCTIREIHDWHGTTILLFQEHDNSHVWRAHPKFPFEPGFWSENFRPVVENKTDISFAHEILRKVASRDQVRA